MFLIATSGSAATWTVGNATGYAGDVVNVAIALSGDGTTTAAELDVVFEEARLALPVASGGIPNANRAGSCARTSSNKLTALIYSSNGSPLASQSTTICVIPFQIPQGTPTGRTPLVASLATCGNGTSSLPCSVVAGWVDVLGGPSAAMSVSQPYETNTVTALLKAPRQAPSIETVVGHDFQRFASTSPLESMRKVPPLRARAASVAVPQGDYRGRLDRAPDSVEAKLERYVYLDFGSASERNAALKLLQRDPAVETAYVVVAVPENVADWRQAAKSAANAKATGTLDQYHLAQLNVPQAQQLAGGWGLVAALDNGLDPNHTELRSFTGLNSVGGSRVAGGNYLPLFSLNVGGRSQPLKDLREIQGNPYLYPYEADCDGHDGSVDGMLNYSLAGHGTHVAGLMAANSQDGGGVSGTCRNCGIAAIKRTNVGCEFNSRAVVLQTSADTDAAGIEHAYQAGAQVLNMSFSNNETNCETAPNNRLCNSLVAAWKNDLLMAASAGNNRQAWLGFPAKDPRVASIGGTGLAGEFWDESPGSLTDCPFPSDERECGSNRASDTGPATKARQELVAPAKAVRSTFYPGRTWNSTVECADGFPSSDNSPTDGVGLCTGTSMSAPIVAGMYGALRSINPLIRVGDPVNQAFPSVPDGIREVVAQTASRSAQGLGEDVRLGFGIPDARAAAAKILGTARTEQVRNRVTPLFGLYSVNGRDHAAVTTPQLAMALSLYSTNAYTGSGTTIPGYGAFPNTEAGQPKARALVLTTEYKSYLASPAVIPLYLLEKKRLGAVPCDPTTDPRCYGDFLLASSTAQVDIAVVAGYVYGGIQGYVYSTCSPEPACMPTGTQRLYMQCNSTVQDCAVFLEQERASFEAQGYTAGISGGSGVVLGYAYPMLDSDLDGSPDGLEYVVGTSELSPNLVYGVS